MRCHPLRIENNKLLKRVIIRLKEHGLQLQARRLLHREVVSNIHNTYVWTTENSYATRARAFQQRFSVMGVAKDLKQNWRQGRGKPDYFLLGLKAFINETPVDVCEKFLTSVKLFANHSLDGVQLVLFLMVENLSLYCKHCCKEVNNMCRRVLIKYITTKKNSTCNCQTYIFIYHLQIS